jgi:hypothetical protein
MTVTVWEATAAWDDLKAALTGERDRLTGLAAVAFGSFRDQTGVKQNAYTDVLDLMDEMTATAVSGEALWADLGQRLKAWCRECVSGTYRDTLLIVSGQWADLNRR